MIIDCPACKGNGSIKIDYSGCLKKTCSVCDGEGVLICLKNKDYKELIEKLALKNKENQTHLIQLL